MNLRPHPGVVTRTALREVNANLRSLRLKKPESKCDRNILTQRQEKHSFSSLFAQTQSYKLAIHTGCKKRGVWSDVRGKLISLALLVIFTWSRWQEVPGELLALCRSGIWNFQGSIKQESVPPCGTVTIKYTIPVVVSLDLSEVVRSANSNVPLDPDSNHQINAHTKRYSESG